MTGLIIAELLALGAIALLGMHGYFDHVWRNAAGLKASRANGVRQGAETLPPPSSYKTGYVSY